MFVRLDARALITSGTRRCASLAASPCDGYTSACTGLRIRYTESDAAHTTEMFFHAAHVALSESFAGDTVLSVHGFSYPGISVSNGTDDSPGDGSFHIRLVEELTAALPAETITSCQDYPGAPCEKRMCGAENVQGRHLNGSPDPCSRNADIPQVMRLAGQAACEGLALTRWFWSEERVEAARITDEICDSYNG